MKRAALPILLCILLPAWAVAQTAPPLGRLFMTPEWRAHLELQRQLDIKETRSVAGESMRLDGVVVRSGGKSTIWINNRPQAEDAGDSGVIADVSPQHPGSAKLSAGSEPPADLKVGATLNRSTRETAGGLASGEIRVNRAAPKK